MTPWGRATLALWLLQIDPDGLGGLALQARSGPVRDAFLALLPRHAPRLHPALSLDALTGGVDVSASLAQGALVQQKGLLETENATITLAMAERTPVLMAATLADWLDQRHGNTLIALDERTEDEAPLPKAIADRLAFHIDLHDLGMHDVTPVDFQPPSDLPDAKADDQCIEELVALAVRLGITSLRAPFLALNAARANAALNRRETVTIEDISVAAELVLAPRATQLSVTDDTPEPSPPEPETQGNPQQSEQTAIPEDILLAAIQTALPRDLLTKTNADRTKGGSGSGAGHKQIGNRKGRPLPARNSATKPPQARVDLLATLRAAVPWQTLRRKTRPTHTNGPIIHPQDLRYRRYEDLSDRLLIFAVDASGSAALARLAEAKGAVELLLAEAYARRDHVALISFRGDAAETLLPPTRSLVQTKRRLADLPGGGGTPLAAGLNAASETAQAAKRKGLSPVIVLLTDGRSNVALDGSPNRAQAAKDATLCAEHIAQSRIDCIVIDTGKRPEKALRDLSLSLWGHYVSLPRADARKLSETVTTALGA